MFVLREREREGGEIEQGGVCWLCVVSRFGDLIEMCVWRERERDEPHKSGISRHFVSIAQLCIVTSDGKKAACPQG